MTTYTCTVFFMEFEFGYEITYYITSFLSWCHIAQVTSYGEPLVTWLVVQTYSEVVSMSTLQAQGHGFYPLCGKEYYNGAVSEASLGC